HPPGEARHGAGATRRVVPSRGGQPHVCVVLGAQRPRRHGKGSQGTARPPWEARRHPVCVYLQATVHRFPGGRRCRRPRASRAGIAAVRGGPPMKATDVRIEHIQHSYEDYTYRTPIKFGGVALDRVTLLNVECRVRTRGGKVGRGVGSMPLSNVWAFPSRV